MVHGLLGIHETVAHRVAEKRLALLIESRNLGSGQFQSLLLFVVQLPAFFAQTFVLLLSLGISHEGVHLLANGLKFGLLDNGFAQLLRFYEDRVFNLNICFHNY